MGGKMTVLCFIESGSMTRKRGVFVFKLAKEYICDVIFPPQMSNKIQF